MLSEPHSQRVSVSSQNGLSINSFVSSLLLPLQAHTLDHLPIKALLALRQACSTTRSLVDDGTCAQWRRIARQLHVPQQLLPEDAQHAPAVHAVLRDQAVQVARIRRGEASLVHQGDLGNHVFTKMSWVLQRSGTAAYNIQNVSSGLLMSILEQECLQESSTRSAVMLVIQQGC